MKMPGPRSEVRAIFQAEWPSLLATDAIGNSERSATFSATASENFATIFSSHSLAETVLVDAATVRGLKRSFHL